MTIKEGFNPDDYGVQYLRQRGYCVVIFNPGELRGVDPDQLQDLLVERGNQIIEQLGDPVECAHEWATNEETDQTYCLLCGEDGDG